MSKSKCTGGLTSAYSLSLSLHTGDSASLTTAGGLKLTPPGYPRASCLGGYANHWGGSTPPPTPRQFKHWFFLSLVCPQLMIAPFRSLLPKFGTICLITSPQPLLFCHSGKNSRLISSLSPSLSHLTICFVFLSS
jgi:hypothetical protein